MTMRVPALAFAGAVLLAAAPGSSATAAENIDAITVYIRCTADGKPVSQGSGVLVSADGLVLTAKHVVPEGYLCEGSIGSSRSPRREMDRTPKSTPLDALLLRFTPGPSETFAYVGYCPITSDLKEKPVKAAGFFPDTSNQGRPSPQPSPRTGIISSVFPDDKGWIQTTVMTTPGMSGGPVLLETNGALLGIVAGASFSLADAQPQFYGVLAAQEIATLLGLEHSGNCQGQGGLLNSATHSQQIVSAGPIAVVVNWTLQDDPAYDVPRTPRTNFFRRALQNRIQTAMDQLAIPRLINPMIQPQVSAGNSSETTPTVYVDWRTMVGESDGFYIWVTVRSDNSSSVPINCGTSAEAPPISNTEIPDLLDKLIARPEVCIRLVLLGQLARSMHQIMLVDCLSPGEHLENGEDNVTRELSIKLPEHLASTAVATNYNIFGVDPLAYSKRCHESVDANDDIAGAFAAYVIGQLNRNPQGLVVTLYLSPGQGPMTYQEIVLSGHVDDDIITIAQWIANEMVDGTDQ